MIKTNPEGLKLGKCEYLINFPDSIFGSYPIQNNTVVISKGDLINGNNDYLLSTVDEASDKIKIGIQFTGAYNNEAVLQDEEVQLLHCIFTITNPSLLAELEATDFQMQGDIWYECKGRLVPFDDVFFKSGLEVITTFGTAGIDFYLQKFAFRTQGTLQIVNFDIYASSTESTTLNAAELYINYASSAFGTFLETNSLTSFSPVTGFGYLTSISDAGANILKLEITYNAPNSPPFILGAQPIKLVTVGLVVQNCSETAGISWNSLTNNTNQTYEDEDSGNILQYSSVSFSGELNLPMCGCNQPDAPEITSFSESQVRAGVGERLTIYGDNFGEVIVKGSCYIEVDNADHAFPSDQQNPGWSSTGRTRIKLKDIIDWTNDAITFIVPSTTLGKSSAAMESGKIIVFNECGESDDKNMDVEYAVANIRPSASGDAYRVALEKQTADGIHFTFNEDVGTYERTLTKNAVKKWCGQTNIGWSIGGNTSSSEVHPNDNINLVVEVDPQTNPFLAVGVHAGVVWAGEIDDESYIESCTNENGSKVYYVRNIDILINEDTDFGSQDSPLDWAESKAIFLHELGHAHLLEHAAVVFGSGQVQKLMYYTSAFNNYSIKDADSNGAESVFSASQALLSDGDCPSPIEASGCPNSVDDFSIQHDLSIMPNPFISTITFELNAPFSPSTNIAIYSMTGQVLYEKVFDSNTRLVVSGLDFLNNGMYVVKIKNQEIDWSGKIIKID